MVNQSEIEGTGFCTRSPRIRKILQRVSRLTCNSAEYKARLEIKINAAHRRERSSA